MPSGLVGWDFLEQLEVGVDLNINGDTVLQAGQAALGSNERLKDKNRRAQKRARDKKKVKRLAKTDQPLLPSCCLVGGLHHVILYRNVHRP